MMGRAARFDAEAREKFLEELRRRGNVTDAARAAGFGRSVAYEHRKADSEFAAAWKDALDEAADALEREAWRRGAEGVSRPVYQQGREVGVIQEYSDALLVHMLKAHRPEKYRERHSIALNTNPQPFGEDQDHADALWNRLSPEEKAMFAKLGREDAKRGPLQHQEETAMSTAGIGLQNVASSSSKISSPSSLGLVPPPEATALAGRHQAVSRTSGKARSDRARCDKFPWGLAATLTVGDEHALLAMAFPKEHGVQQGELVESKRLSATIDFIKERQRECTEAKLATPSTTLRKAHLLRAGTPRRTTTGSSVEAGP